MRFFVYVCIKEMWCRAKRGGLEVSQSGYRLRLNVRRLSFIMQSLQAAILTPEGGLRGYPYIKNSRYR